MSDNELEKILSHFDRKYIIVEDRQLTSFRYNICDSLISHSLGTSKKSTCLRQPHLIFANLLIYTFSLTRWTCMTWIIHKFWSNKTMFRERVKGSYRGMKTGLINHTTHKLQKNFHDAFWKPCTAPTIKFFIKDFFSK